jgi:Ribbon-helix-helix protein, copG family
VNAVSTETVTIRMSRDEIARVDELRGDGVSRSAFVRELLRRAGPLDDAPSYAEALTLLARSARGGKVQAQVALERALRGAQGDDGDDWLAARMRVISTMGGHEEAPMPTMRRRVLEDGKATRDGAVLRAETRDSLCDVLLDVVEPDLAAPRRGPDLGPGMEQPGVVLADRHHGGRVAADTSIDGSDHPRAGRNVDRPAAGVPVFGADERVVARQVLVAMEPPVRGVVQHAAVLGQHRGRDRLPGPASWTRNVTSVRDERPAAQTDRIGAGTERRLLLTPFRRRRGGRSVGHQVELRREPGCESEQHSPPP